MTEVWQKRSTSQSARIEVGLSDFEPAQLLQQLINDELLTADEALSILKRNGVGIASPTVIKAVPDEIGDAWNEIQRGRKHEALIHIERALGNHWLGRLS